MLPQAAMKNVWQTVGSTLGHRIGRNRLRVWVQWLGLGLACSLLMVSCSGSGPNPTVGPANGKDAGRLTLGTIATVSTIDPADASTTFAGLLLYNLADRLYTYKLGTNQIEPQLATAMPQVSADGLVYTMALRSGVKFHDGTPFNAAAMAFSLNRFMKNGGSPAFLLSDTIDSVAPSGDLELQIKLKKPFAAFPALLTYFGACAVSPQAYEIKEQSFKPKEFVGTGPYKLTEFGTDRIRLEPFDQYWGGNPANQGVDIQRVSNAANLFNAFRTGAVDLAFQSLAVEQIQTLRQQAPIQGWQVIEQPGSGIDYLVLNAKSPPLDKLEVRQALAAMMDRELLADRVFSGQVAPLYSLIPTTLKEQDPAFQRAYGDVLGSARLGNPHEVNPPGRDRLTIGMAMAKTLLEKVGYSEQNPLKLEFWYRSELNNDQLAVLTLKAQVQKQLGKLVQFELQSVESTTAYKNLDKGAYPMFLLDWSPDFFDPDNFINPFISCDKGSALEGCTEGQSASQGSFYYNDRANKLIDQSRLTRDPAQRQQLFGQLQATVAAEVPFIPLWQSKDFLFVQKGVGGASLEVTQKVPFWTLKKGA
jgi:peptide/nickel transport system substrate-binding protein